MMFRRASNAYSQAPVLETPYQKGRQVWDERTGEVLVRARNWRAIAFGCLALAFVSNAGLVWQLGRSTITPYVVEVDAIGEARAVGPAVEAYEPTDAQVAYALARFIENIRSLSTDPVVVRRNWLRAYDFATAEAAAMLNDYARRNDPFADIGRRTVAIEITSVIRASDDSFDVRWREERFENGALAETARYSAIISVVVQPPRTEEALRRNPLGIYVRGLNWSRDAVAGENP